VSHRDAFEDEMEFARRISDQDADRALAGLPPHPSQDGGLDEVAAFTRALRAAVSTPLDSGAEAAMVARLAGTARSASDRMASAPTAELPGAGTARRRTWRPRLALAAKVAVAVALVPAAMTGLAFAGVTLPEPAREAMERLGLDLPNQSAVDEPTADDDGDDEASSHAHEGSAAAGESSHRANGESAGRGNSGPREGARAHGKDKQKSKPQKSEPQKSEPEGGGPPAVPPGHGGVPPGQATKAPKPVKTPKPPKPPKEPKAPKEQKRQLQAGGGGAEKRYDGSVLE
jgi:hypothetical protein